MKGSYHLIVLLSVFLAADGTINDTNIDEDSDDFSHFELAVKSGYFVDKSLLLKDFYDHQPALITCPHNFGKTTNLDMARRFFEIPIDRESGELIPRKDSRYCPLFPKISPTLNIGQHREFVRQHFCSHPVLYVRFVNTQGSTTEEIMKSITQKILNVIQSYAWAYKKIETEYEKTRSARLNVYLRNYKKIFDLSAEPYDLLDVLEDLAEFLKQSFAIDIIVLIDDYDVPTMRAINSGADAPIIDGFMHALIGKFVKLGRVPCIVMIAGVSRLFKQDVGGSDGINTLQHNYFSEARNDLGKYFGFVEGEVHQLLAANNVSDIDQENVTKYFNGFTSKKNTWTDNEEVRLPLYNAKGVVRYLRTNATEYLYHGDDLVSNIMKCSRHEKVFYVIARLLTKLKISSHKLFHMTKSHLRHFVKMVKTNCSTLHEFLPYTTPLIDYGYLTEDGLTPNKMAEYKLKRDFSNFYSDYYGINTSNTRIATAIQSVVDSNTSDTVLTTLADSLQQVVQTARHQCNKFEFLSIIFGLLYRNSDMSAEHTAVTKLRHTNNTWEKFFYGVDTLNVLYTAQKTVLIFKVTFKEDLKKAIDEVRNYVPLQPPNATSITSVKYLGINMNEKNQLEVEMGESRDNW